MGSVRATGKAFDKPDKCDTRRCDDRELDEVFGLWLHLGFLSLSSYYMDCNRCDQKL